MVLLRQQIEKLEETILSPRAALSKNSRGRRREEKQCDVRTDFQRDRDRIIHSKSFRRLKHKTQVFIAPEGDHYRTRLTHTLEVSQIARTAARALRLNEDLTEAIALGHDLGHTPFGHAGEEALHDLLPGGFRHNEQSLRVVEHLEGDGGLNLTWEVRDGIHKHTGPEEPLTLEGQLVRICDRIAYINHDIDDALRAGILQSGQLPEREMTYVGWTGSERINTMIRDLMQNSNDAPCITTSDGLKEVMDSLRDFLFKNVYVGSAAKSEEQKAKKIIKMLYRYWIEHTHELGAELLEQSTRYGVERTVADYIAGMTDRYIIAIFEEIFLPRPWKA
ncbi:MAG: deoxyguanosinetriphosphate triphosphohydrolase [Bacillota bacterium]